MIVYLDTNIILTRYSPEEHCHEEAKELLTKVEDDDLSAVTSVLTLVEVVCTTSRAYERFNHKFRELGREAVAGAFLRRVLSIKNLEFIPIGGEVSVKAGEGQVELPALFALALEIGSKTGVKTLDTLHLASAAVAGRIYGQKIDCFVTLDEDILKRKESISSLIDSKVVSLSEKIDY
ncbi:MAG: type II toxin-antitoxin system VapC family toxin [Candidatus Bathyarchaeia archaeon]|jgi:predicted nucleic acid-binding protein